MGITKVFLNGAVKTPFKVKVTKELERGIDVAELHFTGGTLPKENDKVLVLFDVADLANLEFIAHFEGHAKDESGKERHLTGVNNPTFVTGKYGKATQLLASSNQYYTFPAAVSLSGPFTLVFTFNKYTDNNRPLLGNTTGGTNGAKLLFLTNNQLFFRAVDGASFVSADIGYTSALNNKFNVLAVKRDASNAVKAKLNNGSWVTLGTLAGTFTFSLLGRNVDGQNWDGAFDVTRIYSAELSDIELANIYNLKYHISTIKFGGHIWKIDDTVTPRICYCKSFGKQISEITVIEKVYNNMTVDAIAQDLIEINTTLTFVKGPSNVASPTLVQFIAKGHLIELLNLLANQSNKTFYTDGLEQFHWDDNSAEQLPLTYTHGQNAILTVSGYDDTQLTNQLTVKGRSITYRARDTFTGDGSTKVFTAGFLVIDPLVTVNGVVKNALTDYEVNTHNKTITFVNAPANGASIVIEYSYEVPVTVQVKDDASIAKYGVRGKEIMGPCIATIGDATRFGAFYLQAFKEVKQKVNVKIPKIDIEVENNGIIHLVNSVKNINSAFTVKSVTWEYPGITTLDCGEFTFEQFELHKQIVSALHFLQELSSINTEVRKFKYLKEEIGLTDTVTRKTLQRARYNVARYNSTSVYR